MDLPTLEMSYKWSHINVAFHINLVNVYLATITSIMFPSFMQVLTHVSLQVIPDLWWFHWWFWNFTVVQKQYTFSRNRISNFEFWSWVSNTWYYALSCWVVTITLASSQPRSHEGKQLIYLKPFCFSLSVLYSIHYMRYSIFQL